MLNLKRRASNMSFADQMELLEVIDIGMIVLFGAALLLEITGLKID